MSENNGTFSDILFNDFFMVEFMFFFYDEIYDLVSLGFEEEKSRKTQKNIFKKKIIKKT
jgi:hypothetical protein